MANDFSGDEHCVALWRFESGALATDSIGSNTWVDEGAPGDPVEADTTNYKEGSCAALFQDGASAFFISNSNLAADIPLKSTCAVDTFSICFWWKPTYLYSDTLESMISKGNYPAATIDIVAGYSSSDSTPNVLEVIHKNQRIRVSDSLVAGRWYHVAIVIDGTANKTFFCRVWDDTAQSYEDTSTTLNDTLYSNTSDFYLGYLEDMTFDELVLFDDLLSTDEIDDIRSGTYVMEGPATADGDASISPFAGTGETGLRVESVEIEPFVPGARDFSFTGDVAGTTWIDDPITGAAVAGEGELLAYGAATVSAFTGSGSAENNTAIGDGEINPPYRRIFSGSARISLHPRTMRLPALAGSSVADIATRATGSKTLPRITGSAEAETAKFARAAATLTAFQGSGKTCLATRSQSIAPFTGSAQADQETRALGSGAVRAFTGAGQTQPLARGARSLPAFTGAGRAGLQTVSRSVPKFTGSGAATSARILAGAGTVRPFTGAGATVLTAQGAAELYDLEAAGRCGIKVRAGAVPQVTGAAAAIREKLVLAGGALPTIAGSAQTSRDRMTGHDAELPAPMGSGRTLSDKLAVGAAGFEPFIQGEIATGAEGSGGGSFATSHSRFENFILRYRR
jgi:hypothetical protein